MGKHQASAPHFCTNPWEGVFRFFVPRVRLVFPRQLVSHNSQSWPIEKEDRPPKTNGSLKLGSVAPAFLDIFLWLSMKTVSFPQKRQSNKTKCPKSQRPTKETSFPPYNIENKQKSWLLLLLLPLLQRPDPPSYQREELLVSNRFSVVTLSSCWVRRRLQMGKHLKLFLLWRISALPGKSTDQLS